VTEGNNTADFSYPSDRTIILTRIFDVPRKFVFKVYTDPNLIPQWWGPASLATTVDKMDVRTGGVWKFVQYGPEGNRYVFNGVYREIIRPERIVNTFEFGGMPGRVLVEIKTFEELPGGKTKLSVSSVFETVGDRDDMLESGMEHGSIESMERFAALLKEKTKYIA
jgi:uncharacterized protein YndB with AHSA1/START domain